MFDFTSRHCAPIPEGTPAISVDKARQLLAQLPGWEIDASGAALRREFKFKSYAQTMAFVNAVAFLAEREDHHPDMEVSWGRCVVRWNTHTVKGISENDFICAAKVSALFASA